MWIALKENLEEGSYLFVPQNNVIALSTVGDTWGVTVFSPTKEEKEEHFNTKQLAFINAPWEVNTAPWFRVIEGRPVLVSDPKVS